MADEQVTEGTPAGPTAPNGTGQSGVQREAPKVSPEREALVTWWGGQVRNALTQHEHRFKKMRDNQRFARGHQWPQGQSENYVANITLRQINQRVAQLYAKNPTAVAHARKKLDNTIWDGTIGQLQQAHETMAMAQQAGPSLMQPGNEQYVMVVQQQVAQAQQVIADHQHVMQLKRMRERMGETLELLFDYNVDEQILPFKTMMKLAVRRALTTGVGWVKLGYQRVTDITPDAMTRINDMSNQLAEIQSGTADMMDGENKPGDKELEQLRLMIQSVAQSGEVLLRQGLTFDFPSSTSIIPDPGCVHLKTFAGASWVAQEYLLTPAQIQRIYGIDIRTQYQAYNGVAQEMSGRYPGAPPNAGLDGAIADEQKAASDALAKLWSVYCKEDGLVYNVVDGYVDFMTEPAPPDVWLERFYPWFGIIFNEVDDDTDKNDAIWPVSDVELVYHAQMEINRTRESLREHRIANRPAYASATGMLSEQDKQRLKDREAHAVLELQALQPGQKVDDLLQAVKPAPIDPALYNTAPQFEDVLRAGGMQEANLGGTAGATATESSIAAASLNQTNSSSVDDLDEVLSGLARGGGQILLDNVPAEVVRQIVGDGAVWPELSRGMIARDLWLEIAAGSTGRPNQAQEIGNAERIVPLLLQIPGVSPDWLAKDVVRRLDDRIDIDAALASGLPSITSMNSMAAPAGAAGVSEGPQGAQNVAPGPGAGGSGPGVDTRQPAPGGPPPSSPGQPPT